jgi:hypothetical protein
VADTGKIVTKGLHAGAIKYVVLKGLVPNPSGVTSVNACFITKGLGVANRHKKVLFGLSTNPSVGPSTAGAYPLFGGTVIG